MRPVFFWGSGDGRSGLFGVLVAYEHGGRVVIRRGWFLALVLVLGVFQLLPGVGVRDARALVLWTGGPDSPCYVASSTNYPATCSRADAYAACMMHNNYWKTHGSVNASGCVVTATVSGGVKGSYGSKLSSTNVANYFSWGFSCPAGATWNDSLKQCFDPSVCLAHNEGIASQGPVPRTWTNYCPASACELVLDSPEQTTVGTSTIFRGTLRYTGNACTPGDAGSPTGPDSDASDPDPQTCVAASGGQNVCIKPNGEHCYSGPIGKPLQFCWRPGETGQKTSSDVLQVRGPGTSTPTPAPPASGDALDPKDAPMTSTTHTSGGATVVTTVQNYTTVNGTDAGDVDQGEPPDGTGSPPPGGDGENGSASGGADCDAPPSCSGDPVNCAVLDQTWRNRCSANGHKLTDGGCGTDGGVLSFTCSGDSVMCKQALLLKEAACHSESDRLALDLDNADGGGDDDGFQLSDLWASPTGQSLDGNLVNLQGAGELIPTVEFAPGQVFGEPAGFSDLLSKIRFLVVAAFMIWAAFVAGKVV